MMTHNQLTLEFISNVALWWKITLYSNCSLISVYLHEWFCAHVDKVDCLGIFHDYYSKFVPLSLYLCE